MSTYHKIQSIYKRDPATKFRTLLLNDYSTSAIDYLAKNHWVFTEKVDGTNIRVMIDKGGRITFGGRTDAAQIPADLFTRLTDIFWTQAKALNEQFPGGVTLYGEGYGAKIQKGGGNYRPDQDFVLFDIKVDDWWLGRDNIEGIAKLFDLDTVPIIGAGNLDFMTHMVREGFNSQWGDFQAEGIVARPMVELRDRNGHRIITKLKTKDFDG